MLAVPSVLTTARLARTMVILLVGAEAVEDEVASMTVGAEVEAVVGSMIVVDVEEAAEDEVASTTVGVEAAGAAHLQIVVEWATSRARR